MVFGEIIEPSTRAFIDDEYSDFTEYELPQYKWTNKPELFSDIESLVFIETKRIKDVIEKFVLQDSTLVNSLNKCLDIYNKGNSVIVIYEEAKSTEDELTTGEIVEALEPWIKKTQQIYTITSSSLTSHHKNFNQEPLECLAESLFTKNSFNFDIKKLSTPNLITGLGSNILSYCIYNNIECSSFIFYLNNTPPDSINTKPILDLVKNMSLSPNLYTLRMTVPSHNLYI